MVQTDIFEQFPGQGVKVAWPCNTIMDFLAQSDDWLRQTLQCQCSWFFSVFKVPLRLVTQLGNHIPNTTEDLFSIYTTVQKFGISKIYFNTNKYLT